MVNLIYNMCSYNCEYLIKDEKLKVTLIIGTSAYCLICRTNF